MKRLVDVHTGEIMAGSNETVLHSDSHNRCMVICAYDSTKKIGGLAHAMFLSAGRLNKKISRHTLKDAGGAIDEMIDDMLLLVFGHFIYSLLCPWVLPASQKNQTNPKTTK